MSQQITNRVVLSVVVSLSAVCLTMVSRAEKPPVEIQSPQPQGQTVEQTRKNIQVLKGLPESQLFLLMNFGRFTGRAVRILPRQQGQGPEDRFHELGLGER